MQNLRGQVLTLQTWLYWQWPVLTWDGCAECHKHHGSDRVLEADGAAEVRRQVPDDGREQADDDDGDDETGPAVQVVRGRNAGEQDLPEDGEEVHDVVETGRQPFFPCVIFVLISLVKVGASGGEGRGGGGDGGVKGGTDWKVMGWQEGAERQGGGGGGGRDGRIFDRRRRERGEGGEVNIKRGGREQRTQRDRGKEKVEREQGG